VVAMNAKILAAVSLAIASVTLIGCGGGGGDDVKWEGFKFVSQEFTMDEVSKTVQVPAGEAGQTTGMPAKLSGRVFMGFDADDASGFGIDVKYSGKMESPQGNMDMSGDIFYMFSIAAKRHYMCNTTSMKFSGKNPETGEPMEMDMGSVKGCMYMDAPSVTKEAFNDCVNGEAGKLTVTDEDGLHKVKMAPPGTPAEAPAGYLFVDNSNMIKKVQIPFGEKAGDSETITGSAKAITAAAFSAPGAYEGEKWPGVQVPNIVEDAPEMPAELPIQALLECVGFQFKPAGNDLMATNFAKMAPVARAHLAKLEAASETKPKMVAV